MVSYCAAIGCKSDGYMKYRKFFRFPMINKRSHRTMAITQARQQAWLVALNRDNFFAHQFQHARVCDLHFVSGKLLCLNSSVNRSEFI